MTRTENPHHTHQRGQKSTDMGEKNNGIVSKWDYDKFTVITELFRVKLSPLRYPIYMMRLNSCCVHMQRKQCTLMNLVRHCFEDAFSDELPVALYCFGVAHTKRLGCIHRPLKQNACETPCITLNTQTFKISFCKNRTVKLIQLSIFKNHSFSGLSQHLYQ